MMGLLAPVIRPCANLAMSDGVHGRALSGAAWLCTGHGERGAGQRRGALSNMSSCRSAGQGQSTAREAIHTTQGRKAVMC